MGHMDVFDFSTKRIWFCCWLSFALALGVQVESHSDSVTIRVYLLFATVYLELRNKKGARDE